MEDDEIIVSKEMLKAIGADTRIAILKSLLTRQKTQSEIASQLNFSAPTVLEHVEHLAKAGLVERVEEDTKRKWKYYRLTKTGRKLVEGKKMHVVVLLAASILVAIGALYMMIMPFSPEQKESRATEPTAVPQNAETLSIAAAKTSAPAWQGENSLKAAAEDTALKGDSQEQKEQLKETPKPLPIFETALLVISLVAVAVCGWHLIKNSN